MNDKLVSRRYHNLINRITEIYFSELRFKLKNDCVCRLISGYFDNASAVSILLYNSKRQIDNLTNFGHYLEPIKSKAVFSDSATETLLKNISIFEFFAYRYETGGELNKCTYDNFTQHTCFVNYDSVGRRINKRKIFYAIKRLFVTDDNSEIPMGYQIYKRYKSVISRNDRYNLRESKSPSSLYFNSLVFSPKKSIYNKNFEVFNPQKLVDSDKVFYNVYRNDLNISIDDKHIYLAIPLFFGKRFIGLIRVLWNSSHLPNTAKTSKDDVKVIKSWIKRSYNNEISDLISIIATNIGSSYSNYEFKKLERLPSPDYFEYSESFVRTIHSMGCVIRAGDDKHSEPKIIGYNRSSIPETEGLITTYVEGLIRNKDDHFLRHVNILIELFNPPNKKDSHEISKIIGVQFNVGLRRFENFKYYYFSKNEILKVTSDYREFITSGDSKIKSMFDSDVHRKLLELDISEVLIIKIPNIDNGYISIANTKYRPLNQKDIEVIYSQVLRLGTDLHNKQSSDLKLRALFLESFQHELRQPIGLAAAKLNMINVYIENIRSIGLAETELLSLAKKILNKNFNTLITKQCQYLVNLADSRLHEIRRVNEMMQGRLKATNVLPYPFARTVEEVVCMYRELVIDKKGIGINLEFDRNCMQMLVTFDNEFLAGLFMNLLDNAIKYSFPSSQMLKHGIEFDTNFHNESDGHIKVHCINNYRNFGFSITNWGKKIPKDMLGNVFKPHFSCPPDVDFRAFEPTYKNGLGLYISERYAAILGAEIEIIADSFITKVNVIWQK